METKKGIALASSVAALLFTVGCGSSDDAKSTSASKQDALVKCEGVNECKGTSECKGSDGNSACQGLNECKGQGWVTVPAEECSQKGGKVLDEQAASGAPGPAPAPAPEPKTASVKCEGINECKGTSACKSGDHACKGQNECKGHGFLEVPSADECTEKGGKVIA